MTRLTTPRTLSISRELSAIMNIFWFMKNVANVLTTKRRLLVVSNRLLFQGKYPGCSCPLSCRGRAAVEQQS